MYSRQNAWAQNNQGVGNVIQGFERMKNLISVNDGARSFTPRLVTCHDQQAPFEQNQMTYLNITSNDHHVSHISDGYIHMIVQLTVNMSLAGGTGNFAFDDDIQNHLGKIFIGLKDSNQIFRQMYIRNRNRGTGYEQSEMCREGFALCQSMSHPSKKSRKYNHTLFDNAYKYNENICGTFVDASLLADGDDHEIEFELVIPFDDICALQAFSFFPNCVLGEIELQFYVGQQGLVYLPLEPERVWDVKTYLQGQVIPPIVHSTVGDMQPCNHTFTQMGNQAFGLKSITAVEDDETVVSYTYEVAPIRIACTRLRVLSCESNMSGFKVRDSTFRRLYEMFREPCYIPAEYLEYNAFPTAPNSGGLQSTQNLSLSNVKDIYIMFPRHSNDYTVFENPCIQNFQLNVNGTYYPERSVSTLGPRFYQMELTAADLDGPLRPTNEFIDSYTMNKNDATGKQYAITTRDGSSFCLIIQTERNESGYVFDGIDSNGQNIAMAVQFNPLWAGEDDTYFNVDAQFGADNIHPPAPQIWLCRDVYWEMSSDGGLVFNKNGEPPGSQAA
jgi:hypothetical protein